MEDRFRWRKSRIVPALLSVLLFFAGSAIFSRSHSSEASAYSFIATPGAATRGVAALYRALDREIETFRLVVEPSTIVLTGRSPGANHVEEWRLEHSRYWRWVSERVTGPGRSPSAGAALQIDGGFFDPADIDLNLLPNLAREAIARARLHGGGAMGKVIIERRVRGGRPSSFEEVRFVLPVASGEETAIIHADIDGRITGADLSRTSRRGAIDIIAEAELMMTEANEALRAEIGSERVVHELSLQADQIRVEVGHRAAPGVQEIVRWNPGGVRRTPDIIGSMGGSVAELRSRMRGTLPFSLEEIDLRLVPEIIAAARQGLNDEEGLIFQMTARRSAKELRESPVIWSVDIGSSRQTARTALVDARGNLVGTNDALPEEADWLEPAAIARGIDIVTAAFGTEAYLEEIEFRSGRVTISAADPLAAGTVGEFGIENGRVTRSAVLVARPEVFRRPLFKAERLQSLSPLTIAALVARGLEDLGATGGKLERLTISHGTMVEAAPDERITIEIRAMRPNGRDGGWALYTADGAVVRVIRQD